MQERGRTIEGVLLQYNKFVKNAYKEFIYPTIRYADLIVPGSRNNKVSVDFIVRHMKNMTKEMYPICDIQTILQKGDQH